MLSIKILKRSSTIASKYGNILLRHRRYNSNMSLGKSIMHGMKPRTRIWSVRVGTGLLLGGAAMTMKQENDSNSTDKQTSEKKSHETEKQKEKEKGNKNEEEESIEKSHKRLMASILVPDHYGITWCWLYVSRFVFLFFNFLPMIFMAPFAYTFPNRYKEYWLNLMRNSFGNAGSTFIKLAQWISMREDIFPLEICNALSGLRTQAPIHSFEETCRVIEQSFGRKVDEIFERFYVVPVASGSIAQVHRAQLCVEMPSIDDENDESDTFNHNDNENQNSEMDTNNSKYSNENEKLSVYLKNKAFKTKKEMKLIDVAVKVTHPNILQDMAIDISILYGLSNLVSMIPGLRGLKVPIYQPKFAEYLESQIDLSYEAESLQIFNQNFKTDRNSKQKHSYLSYFYDTQSHSNKSWSENINWHIWRYKKEHSQNADKTKSSENTGVIFPCPIKGLISKQCLVETWEYGIPLCDLDLEKLSMDKRKTLAKQCYDVFMKMLLRDNFIHGDCHSGNILIRGEHIEGPLVFLDAGLTASLSREGNDVFAELMGHIVTGKTYEAAELFSQWCMGLEDNEEGRARKQRFVDGLGSTIEKHLQWHSSESELKIGIPYINVGSLLRDVLDLTQKEEIVLESQFSAVIASLGVIEGLIKYLYPKADFLSWGVPYLIKHKKILTIKYLMQYVT